MVSFVGFVGGFTLAELDRVLVPYAKKTMNNARAEFDEFVKGTDEQRERFAWHKLERELEQGFQSLELKLNTVPSSKQYLLLHSVMNVEYPSENGETLERVNSVPRPRKR